MTVLRLIKSRARKTARHPVRKRCARCGEVGWFGRAEKMCREPSFGKGSFACGGALEKAPIVRRRRERGDDLRQAMAEARLVTPEAAVKAERVREAAAAELHKVEKKLADELTTLKRVVGRVDKLRRKAQYYSRRASVTPFQVQAELARRKAGAS